MATGTGKTKLAIALLYRLLSVKRFRRVCFVVDRSALGDQASSEFRTTKVIGPRAFAHIFHLRGLDDITPEPETEVQICTIEGLVKRVLFADEPGNVPTIDGYPALLSKPIPNSGSSQISAMQPITSYSTNRPGSTISPPSPGLGVGRQSYPRSTTFHEVRRLIRFGRPLSVPTGRIRRAR